MTSEMADVVYGGANCTKFCISESQRDRKLGSPGKELESSSDFVTLKICKFYTVVIMF